MIRIALLGELDPGRRSHAATGDALAHSSQAIGVSVVPEWISTVDAGPELFERFHGLWVAPGSPYRDLGRTLSVIEHARENALPCLGTCGGFQHMILEYARNVLGFVDAQHAEYDPYASRLFISKLACSLAGREMELSFAPGSQVAGIYRAATATEEYYCNFGVAPEHVDLLGSGPLRISGSDAEGEVRVIELPSHPFFIGTLFVPQMRSRIGQPHPLVTAFLAAARDGPEGR